jgi:hypothetical protein|tara:strand:+ start:7839 stop:8210 length:372 start_codon:yes stop_codon:yes gene_type:complete
LALEKENRMTNQNKMNVLADKNLDVKKSLQRELYISTALQVEFPDVFDGGDINTRMGRDGDDAVYPDEYRITITKGIGEAIEVQLKDTNLSDEILKLMMPKNVTWRKPEAVQDRENYLGGQNV